MKSLNVIPDINDIYNEERMNSARYLRIGQENELNLKGGFINSFHHFMFKPVPIFETRTHTDILTKHSDIIDIVQHSTYSDNSDLSKYYLHRFFTALCPANIGLITNILSNNSLLFQLFETANSYHVQSDQLATITPPESPIIRADYPGTNEEYETYLSDYFEYVYNTHPHTTLSIHVSDLKNTYDQLLEAIRGTDDNVNTTNSYYSDNGNLYFGSGGSYTPIDHDITPDELLMNRVTYEYLHKKSGTDFDIFTYLDRHRLPSRKHINLMISIKTSYYFT
jgi:hypothetical protein